jgi:hypothetical protein
VPVYQTVEVPVTIVAWQTVEVPVTIVAVQTVQVPVIVEVVQTRIVTIEIPVTVEVAPIAQPAATPAVVAATQPPPPPTQPPAPQTHPYLAIARVQNDELFRCMAILSAYEPPSGRATRDQTAAAVAGLTAEGSRVAAIRSALQNAPSPPPELGRAHNLMLEACDHLAFAVQCFWAARSADNSLDEAYAHNIEAQTILKQYAGE